jgi:hypothetical protein
VVVLVRHVCGTPGGKVPLMRVILRVRDIDGQNMHDIVLDGGAPIPAVEDYITFEVRSGEWVTREVTTREGFRYEDDVVIVGLEVTALEDDEEAPRS